ncbi:hypothetical protein HU742_018320 [Pseudomonas sp. SWRI102]|uniref:Uncharacterized protein n=1 Tax=Pseudomonas marvdashtae TaxID=2745500 RepID=A0A923FLJ8_9PSED|nr:hypothetical protein [Pseudomonas marvdashtae]MBV4553104.1 hypothetical protein [Pseudomonas marvdashtae]
MTNKTITLSRELAEQILKELTSGAVSIGTGAKLRAALADPVPPVGGEPEVLGYLDHASTYYPGLESVEQYGQGRNMRELVDRAHVTRLQAEVFELRTALQVANKNTKQVMAQRDTISVQLFKANDDALEYMTKMKRAQAEVEEWKLRCQYNADTAHDLQSELTKAREVEHDLRDRKNSIVALRRELSKAREWLGDGKNADGLAREHWTPEYAALIDRIDTTLSK